MLLTVTVNYGCGLLIDKSKKTSLKTLYMVIGVTLSLAFLVYFKYFGFFSDVVTGLLGVENTFEKPVLRYTRKGAAAACRRIAKRIRGLSEPVSIR